VSDVLPSPFIASRVQVKPIHDEIHPPEDTNTVRYIHLQEVPDQYSMGIFVFPPHAKIPLHDHPGMCVLSRVLYGSLHRLSLDLPRNPPQTTTSWWKGPRRSASHHHHHNNSNVRRIAYQNRIDHLQAPDVTVLYPYEGNLHEFVAGAHGAAVLDVLLPPYDVGHNRDCTFYHIQDCEENNYNEGNQSPKPVWIVPTGQPEDFHCLSGVYRELGREEY
jgi:cysteamine dioxygenase